MALTKTPQFQSFHIEGVNHISPADAFEAINNGEAVIIDVRELAETHSNCIPHNNVLYHPMSAIMDRLAHLPTDKLLIVACNSGDRSVRVANLFVIKGFENVANLDGGLVHWKAEGFPFEATPVSSCGCGCSTPASFEKPEPQSECGCSSGCC